MYRVTLVSGAGSDGPRVFETRHAPEQVEEHGPGSRILTRFITDPIGRVVRSPDEEIISIEAQDDDGAWSAYDPEPADEDEEGTD